MRLLIIDDSDAVGRALARVARGLGWDADVAREWSAGQMLLRRARYEFLLVDHGLGDVTGAEAVRLARRLRPALPAALMSGSEAAASEAAAIGCPLLLKPFGREALGALLEAAARTRARVDDDQPRSDGKETPR